MFSLVLYEMDSNEEAMSGNCQLTVISKRHKRDKAGAFALRLCLQVVF